MFVVKYEQYFISLLIFQLLFIARNYLHTLTMQASLSVVDITLPNSIYTYIKAMSLNITLKVKEIVIIYQA